MSLMRTRATRHRAMLLSLLLLTVGLGAPSARSQSGSEDLLAEFAEAAPQRLAYSMYLMKSKYGWGIEESRVGEHEGVAVLLETVTASSVGEAAETARDASTETMVWSLSGEGALLAYTSREVTDGTVTLRSAEVEGAELLITESAAGRITTRQVPRPRATLLARQRFAEWLSADPPAGEVFELPSIEWERSDIDTLEVYEAMGPSSEAHGKTSDTIRHVWMTMDGLRARAEFKTDGTLMRALVGSIMEIRLEPEELAKAFDSSADFMTLMGLPVDQALGDPEAVDALRVVFLDDDGLNLPSAPRQVVSRTEAGQLVLSLKREASVERQSLSAAEREWYLSPTPRIQCADPELQQLAASLTEGSSSLFEKAVDLAGWVLFEVEPSLTRSANTAVDVLANRAGDCTEFALLYVALARAAGIPAREVTGVMYADIDPPSFAWHAWAEIHDGEGWRSVDPGWGQIPVDATHIKFANEDDLSWLARLGESSLQVLEVQRVEIDVEGN